MDSGGSHKKQKTSGAVLDRISMLPDVLLVLIISFLPFKDVLKTSLLSRRWRYLYREVRDISFKESEIINYSINDNEYDQRSKRTDYVRYLVNWVSRYSGGVIESFELSLSYPFGFKNEIKVLIEFAASREVKNLVLDFSSPRWSYRSHEADLEPIMIQLPECVYNLTSLVNLKLFACRFDPSKFAKPGSVKSLYFGWIPLPKITSLLSKTPLLEMLRIESCWNIGLDAITGYNNRLSQLVFENCLFSVKDSKLDLPMIQVFKYSGKFHHFEFVNVNTKLEEVYLDFEEERELINGATRKHFCDLLSVFFSARTLTVCPFLLQRINHNEELVQGKPKMKTQRLILMTNLEPREFRGISFMLNSCPYLETLSFHLVTTTPVYMIDHLFDHEVTAKIFWMLKRSHVCLNETLKNVEMCNFMGREYEVQWLTFMIRNGCVLEKVDLYMQPYAWMNGNQMFVATSAAKFLATEFKASPKLLSVNLHC